MGTFAVHVINVKILPYERIVEKTSVYLDYVSWSLIVDPCVTTVEYVRIVYRNRLLVWMNTVLLICLNKRAGLKDFRNNFHTLKTSLLFVLKKRWENFSFDQLQEK